MFAPLKSSHAAFFGLASPGLSNRGRSGRSRRRGFTLIELLIVITVIGILVGLLLPAVNAVRRSVSETTTAMDIAQIDASLESFKREFGFYPSDFSEFVDANGDALGYGDTIPGFGVTVSARLLQFLTKISPTHNELAIDPVDGTDTRLQVWWENVGMNLAIDSSLAGANKRDSLRGPQVALWFWMTQVFNDAQYPFSGPRFGSTSADDDMDGIPDNEQIVGEQRKFHDFSGASLEVIGEVAYPNPMADLTDPDEAHNVYSVARPVQRGGDAPLVYFHHDTYLDNNHPVTDNTETRIDFEQGNYAANDPPNFGMACRVPGSSAAAGDTPEFLETGKYQILTAGYDETFGDIEDPAIYENNDNLCNFSEGRLGVFVDDYSSN